MKKSQLTKVDSTEQRLARQPAAGWSEDADPYKLIHELQAYQVLLEMQNEELRATRTQAEAALERYTLLYELAPVGYLTLDKTGHVAEINLTGAAILGAQRASIVGQSLTHYFTSSQLLKSHLSKTCQTDGNVISEMQIKHADGKVLDVQLESRFIKNDEGIPCDVRTVMVDISARKSLERELHRQRAEMETLLKQQVAAHTASAIAHELNQPLAAISAYSEVALRTLNSDSVNAEQLQRALQGSVDQAHRAGQSLHELLQFLQDGELISESIDLNRIVHEAITAAQNYGYYDFQPTLALQHDLPPVIGNPVQVQKVLVNLLRNGIEAMHGAGIPASDITINICAMMAGNMVQVTVQDSGPGLDAESAKRLFEPFFTTKPEGIGLELAISRTLIEASGGQLWFDSDVSSGATFHFTLPIDHERIRNAQHQVV